MFSGKFNFIKTTIQVSTSTTNIAPYLTLNYAYNAEPFVNVAGSGNSVLVSKSGQCSLDYAYQGQPFYPNDITFLNS